MAFPVSTSYEPVIPPSRQCLQVTTGVGSGGMQGIWHPQLFMLGDIDMYIPLEKPNTSHANCRQHVLRCWERQSDGSEYKKILWRPGLRPGPRWGSLQRSRKPPSWWDRLAVASPRTPSPLSALRASPLLPLTLKLVPTPLQVTDLRQWTEIGDLLLPVTRSATLHLKMPRLRHLYRTKSENALV